MKNIDNRVRYTKMVLQQALLRILKKKHIDKVTIKEICEEAEINRGTFYLHYSIPNDLLLEIENQFIEDNMSFFTTYMTDSKEVNVLSQLFACVLQNKDICKILMGKNGNPRFIDRLQELVYDSVVNEWRREFPKYSRIDLSYIFDYIFTGSMRLILNWIENDNGLTIDDLALRLDRLGHHCLLSISEFKI